MRLLSLLLLGLILTYSIGCTNSGSINTKQETVDTVKVHITTPADKIILAEPRINIKGNINDQTVKYFFYQIEDGHSFLGDGKITPDLDGQFDVHINFSTKPSNGHGFLLFYLDEDNNGSFDIGTDTKKEIGSIPLSFADSMVQYSADR